jgi:mRNA-degrading endonuclease RelE of RelBE toxin-antitoxin system
MARMKFEIILSPEAVEDFEDIQARDRSLIRSALETHLRHEPTKISKSRIKKLRGITRPQFRLRVGDYRIFNDVTDKAVEVLAIVSKKEAARWLEKFVN